MSSMSRTASSNSEKYPSSPTVQRPERSSPSVAVVNLMDSGSGPSVDMIGLGNPLAPKRANRACCACRRDKIKCNGARPCSGCLKKGLPRESCIDGCIPCRRARSRCDGGKPCTSCIELNIECTEEPSVPYFRPEVYAKAPLVKSKASERAKLACQACRRDNKKCDDQRPCKRCKARSEDCIHIERGPKNVKVRCKRCREEDQKCEDRRPCTFCEEMGVQCTDPPRKGRAHGQRVKSACIYCRRDKIQCDTERPCRGCVRRRLQCVDQTCDCAEKRTGRTCAVCRTRKAQNEIAWSNGTNAKTNSEIDYTPAFLPNYPTAPESSMRSFIEPNVPQRASPTTSTSTSASASQPQPSNRTLLEALSGMPMGSFPPNVAPATASAPMAKYSLDPTTPHGMMPTYGQLDMDAYGVTMPMYGPPLSAPVLQYPFVSGSRHIRTQQYIPMIDPSIENPNQT